MSHFFATSALKSVDPDSIAQGICEYCTSRGVRAEIVTRTHPVKDSTDVLIYAPQNGWVTVLWPTHFNIHDVRLCADLTKRLGTSAVTVNVYEGAFWSMEVLDQGTLVDKFSPWGDYLSEDAESALTARTEWQGNPENAADFIGCKAAALAPYYRYVGDQPAGKAAPDDQFPLEDFWVFTDIWRRAGLNYPHDPSEYCVRVRLDRNFGAKLPAWEGESL